MPYDAETPLLEVSSTQLVHRGSKRGELLEEARGLKGKPNFELSLPYPLESLLFCGCTR
jgi:hypothetical protein